MNTNDHPRDDAGRPEVGDQNVERLLQQAYRPETPDPEFVERVRRRLQAAAGEMPAARAAVVARVLPIPRRVLAWGLVAAAAVVLAVLLLPLLGRRPAQPS